MVKFAIVQIIDHHGNEDELLIRVEEDEVEDYPHDSLLAVPDEYYDEWCAAWRRLSDIEEKIKNYGG